MPFTQLVPQTRQRVPVKYVLPKYRPSRAVSGKGCDLEKREGLIFNYSQQSNFTAPKFCIAMHSAIVTDTPAALHRTIMTLLAKPQGDRLEDHPLTQSILKDL